MQDSWADKNSKIYKVRTETKQQDKGKDTMIYMHIQRLVVDAPGKQLSQTGNLDKKDTNTKTRARESKVRGRRTLD